MAAVDLEAIRKEGVDLVRRVRTLDESITGASTRVRPDRDCITVANRPLALAANESAAQFEHEVVAQPLVDRLADRYAQLDGSGDDRGFSNRSLLGRGKHAEILVVEPDN
ncbi:MAG TPA: hypothetical protein VH816_08920 [Gaiellaceae bacterium]